jgi:D-alanyl-D-alanine dipeptidase
MESAGFRNYNHEWWHYDFPPLTGGAPLDLPIGC